MSPTRDLYDHDFYAWCLTQARLLHDGVWSRLDREHVAKELELLADWFTYDLEHQLEKLLTDLLLWPYAPALPRLGWRKGLHRSVLQSHIHGERGAILKLLAQNPSLRHFVPEMIAEVYPESRQRAEWKLKLPDESLPLECPWTRRQILAVRFFPEDTP